MANATGRTERDWCCACYELTFTSGAVSGKKFIVQATNTGGDLGQNHFDLAVSRPFLSFICLVLCLECQSLVYKV